MSFTGYVFNSKEEIEPYVEQVSDSVSISWAVQTAKRFECRVVIGFPQSDGGRFFNSLAYVDKTGIILIYQKHFLYDADKPWATPGPAFLSFDDPQFGKLGFGICMDLNPWEYKANFFDFEFSTFHQQHGTKIIICIMNWLKSDSVNEDIPEVIKYWAMRLDSFKGKFIACNRIGSEGDTVYCGCSCALDMEKKQLLCFLREEQGVLFLEL